jgi:hypothetical protein
MLMLFDRLTGEVSEVAVCALAGPAVATRSVAATAAISAFLLVDLRQGTRRKRAAKAERVRRSDADAAAAAFRDRLDHDIAEAVDKVSSSPAECNYGRM